MLNGATKRKECQGVHKMLDSLKDVKKSESEWWKSQECWAARNQTKAKEHSPWTEGYPCIPNKVLFPPPKVVQAELGQRAGAGWLSEDASPPLKQKKESWGPEPHLWTPGFIQLRPLNLPRKLLFTAADLERK